MGRDEEGIDILFVCGKCRNVQVYNFADKGRQSYYFTPSHS